MNPKKLKLSKHFVDDLLEAFGARKLTLTWSKGHAVIVHISEALNVVHVMHNPDKRSDEQIQRKLKAIL